MTDPVMALGTSAAKFGHDALALPGALPDEKASLSSRIRCIGRFVCKGDPWLSMAVCLDMG